MNGKVLNLVLFLIEMVVLGTKGEIILAPANEVAKVGERITLKCSIKGEGLFWQWNPAGKLLFHGVGISEPNDPNGKVSEFDPRTGEYNLVINNVQPEDAGLYVCQDKSYDSKGMSLAVVTSGPTAKVSIKHQTPFKVGSEVTTMCRLTYISQYLDLEMTATDGVITKNVVSKTQNDGTPTTAVIKITQIAESSRVPAVDCSFKFTASYDKQDHVDLSDTRTISIKTEELPVSSTV